MSIMVEKNTYTEKLEIVLDTLEKSINAENEENFLSEWKNFLEENVKNLYLFQYEIIKVTLTVKFLM